MSLTKEQLLIPRYMCTGTPGKPLWEGSPFFHGAVFHGEIYRLMNLEVSGHTDYNFSNMPHLFRPMPWWEGRKIEDMPEYVKYGHGAVYKIIEWRENKDYGIYAICERGEDYPLIMQPNTHPATREEYEEFLKQKEVTNGND